MDFENICYKKYNFWASLYDSRGDYVMMCAAELHTEKSQTF